MKKGLLLLGLLSAGAAANAQMYFDPAIPVTDFAPPTVLMPANPLSVQVLFVGGNDYVQTGVNDSVVAKQWHDFIGFSPDTDPNTQDMGWVSINHEMILADDKIGDGGGMTTFKIRRSGDSLVIVPQTLADGRTGKFFNVDFSATGATGMNCGGIMGPDGRIWTAEEWLQSSNVAINASGGGFRDTADFTIANSGISMADGQTVKAYQNLNWMVEIDPKQAKSIRKQYNWGRMEFEGGVILADQKTVFFGADATPGFLCKFVATTAGDFTSGNLYVYKHDDANKWVQVDNSTLANMINFPAQAVAAEGTMFNRMEWFAQDPISGKVYFTETGRDNPGNSWRDESMAGAVHSPAHLARATAQGTHPDSAAYWDYYGRVWEIDPTTSSVEVFLEAGPYLPMGDPQSYPFNHLSNPDGLGFTVINGQSYMLIQEDLNGRSYGRVPAGVNNSFCELYMCDMSDATPTVNELRRLTAVPAGAEVTGATGTPDGKSILINVQHPSTSNPYPYNNSLTFAINGMDKSVISLFEQPDMDDNGFQIYPNPATRELRFNKMSDIAIYDVNGNRVSVHRNVQTIDVTGLASGTYFVMNGDGEVQRLIIQK